MALTEHGGYEREPFIAELYDYTRHYAERRDVPFYLRMAADIRGGILELGCGTGRVLIPLVEAGRRVTGLDLSELMLNRCREKLADLPEEARGRVRLICGNMTGFDLGESFEMVAFPFRSFQHVLNVSDQLACLRCANRHLVMGGRLVMDVFNPQPADLYDPALKEEQVDFKDAPLPDGRRFTRSQRVIAFHPSEQYNDIELIHTVAYPDGRIERLVQSFPWRLFFRYELEHLLFRCGFDVTDVYGNYDCSPLRADSPELIVVARKARAG